MDYSSKANSCNFCDFFLFIDTVNSLRSDSTVIMVCTKFSTREQYTTENGCSGALAAYTVYAIAMTTTVAHSLCGQVSTSSDHGVPQHCNL